MQRSHWFERISCVDWGANMQEDARDWLEVFNFNLTEETIGRWLRAVILRLEKSGAAFLSCTFSES